MVKLTLIALSSLVVWLAINEMTGGLGTAITFKLNEVEADSNPSVTVTETVNGPLIKGIGLIVKTQLGAVPEYEKLAAFTIVRSEDVADRLILEHRITLSTSFTFNATGKDVLSKVDWFAINPIVGASLTGKIVIENSDVTILLACKLPSSKEALI